MEKVLWKDDYSVGVEESDRQHRHLFEILNKLVARPADPSGSELVAQTLGEMYDYAKEHFKAEEELMQQYGYPELEAHKKKHEYLVGTPYEMCSGEISADEIAEFLKVWWIIHVLNVDMKYKDFFKAKLSVPV